MREIKFRAWDMETKLMFKHYIANDVVMLENAEYNKLFKIEECLLTDNPILMQFTGLKTKDGVEIYEGDIITCRDGKFAIEYEDRFAQFIMTNKDMITDMEQLCNQDANTCMRSIEVIGNIYENPKLLEAKAK